MQWAIKCAISFKSASFTFLARHCTNGNWNEQAYSGVTKCSGGGSNVKWHMASAEREPIMGSGAEPPAGFRGRAPGQGVRGRSPPEAERFLGIIRRKDRQYLPLYPTFESAEIATKHCLESK